MKIFASIMAFGVLFLSVQPALALLKQKQSTQCCGGGCHKTTDEKKSSGDNNSPSNNCNPFQSCASNICSFTVTSSFLSIKAPNLYSNNFTPFSENFYSQFAPDFWQPPKIA